MGALIVSVLIARGLAPHHWSRIKPYRRIANLFSLVPFDFFELSGISAAGQEDHEKQRFLLAA